MTSEDEKQQTSVVEKPVSAAHLKLEQLKKAKNKTWQEPLTSLAKPTVKKQKTATAGNNRNELITPDASIASMFAKASEASDGRHVVTSEQAEAMICGIPLPGLVLRYLFQQDILPLSRQIMIYGEPGSAKSALLAELYRCFLKNSGMCVHIDNENKDGPDLRNSILYEDPTFKQKVAVEPSDSQEEWMGKLILWLDVYTSMFAKISDKRTVKRKKEETAADFKKRSARKVFADKPGYIYPFILGLDSVTATSSASTIQDIRDSGAPKRRFQIEAGFLSDLAKALPAMFRDKPAILVMINHRKDNIDPITGYVSDRVPGGNAMRFMDTTEIKTKKIGKFETADFGGIRLTLSIPKNSLGPTGNKINVDFKWWYELDHSTGKAVQRSAWDWPAASIDLLFEIQGSGKKQALAEIVDINKGTKRKVWSNALGIPEKKQVTYHELGRLLEADTERMEAINDLLHIKTRTKFIPGIEYGKIQEHLLASSKRTESIYLNNAIDLSSVAFIEEELDAEVTKTKKKGRPRPVLAASEEDD